MANYKHLIQEAAIARKNKDFKTAEYLLEIMFAKEPDNIPALFEKAMFYKEQQKYDVALEIFCRLLDTKKRILALLEIASINHIVSKFSSQTIETSKNYLNNSLNIYLLAYKEALQQEISEDNYKYQLLALRKIGNIYKEKKELNEEEKYLKFTLELINANSYAKIEDADKVLCDLGYNALQQRDIDKSLDYYKQINDTELRSSKLLEIEQIFYYNKKYDKAQEILLEIKNEKNTFKNLATLYLGKVEMTVQNFELAEYYFLSLLHTNKKTKAIEELISLYYKVENYQAALIYIDQLLEFETSKINIDYYNRFKKIIQIKLNMDVDLENDIRLELEKNYIEQRAIAQIKREFKLKKVKTLNSFKEFFYSIELKDEDYLKTSDKDLYYVYYPNAIIQDNHIYNYIFVATRVNTKDIISIYPAREYEINNLKNTKKRILN